MITTDISRNNVITEVMKLGPDTLKFIHSNGREITANSLIWSTFKNFADTDEPLAGRLNFFQSGSVSGIGIAGFDVSTSSPMKFTLGLDGVPETLETIPDVTDWLINNLSGDLVIG